MNTVQMSNGVTYRHVASSIWQRLVNEERCTVPQPIEGKNRYMPGLDGLRAISVLAVMAYHLGIGFVPGGLLGVGVFFVLSGYLITDLLIAEWARNGKIVMRQFWLRRAKRLLPALFTLLAAVWLWEIFVTPSQLSSLGQDTLAALFYVSNWWYIFHHVSYFAKFGSPSPLTHLWSLAVEEQFYLIWPLLLVFGLRKKNRRSWLVWLTVVLATASALAMALLYQPGSDPNRVYYGTDTRAFSLLIGALLAVIWPSRKLSSKLPSASRWLLDIIGVLGLAVVIWMMVGTNEYETFLYRGGMVLLSVAAALAIAALAHPATLLHRLLGSKPLRWLGVRSYAIYLWHYPIIVLTTPSVQTGGFNYWRAALQVTASILLAALSWRFIEDPIRHGALERMWKSFFGKGGVHRRAHPHSLRRILTVSSVALLLLVGGVFTSYRLRVHAATAQTELRDSRPVPVKVTSNQTKVKSNLTTADANTQKKSLSATDRTNSKTATTASTTYNQGGSWVIGSGAGVIAVGDSVMVDAKPYLEKMLPGIVVNGKVGRQLIEAGPVVDKMRAAGEIQKAAIIELGTNGPFTMGQLQALLADLGPVSHILLVNTRVPRPWQNVVNQMLASEAAANPRVTLVNWYAASRGENQWFYPDGVHLNPVGASHYAALIAHTLLHVEQSGH
ncbi:acyltransferase family protein [Alicyclobacillus tolerans]|uniref:acyltransferase family protein n=1 Tax=Alicyclobacillus tolerans TaxID=90970 RepID=UPI003B7A7F89